MFNKYLTNASVADNVSEAAATPNEVEAVGIGPGHPSYLTDRARESIAAADVVVGFASVVDRVRDVAHGDCLACGYDDEPEVLARFAERVGDGETGVAVLAGDPMVSGSTFVEKVEAAVGAGAAAGATLRVVPGVSSIQVAAARARTPIEASTFVTLHRRGDLRDDLDRLVADAGERHLLVLPRPYDWMPGDVAAHLAARGAPPSLDALVYERLALPDEAATESTLDDLATHAGGDRPEDSPFSDLSVLVVRREEP